MKRSEALFSSTATPFQIHLVERKWRCAFCNCLQSTMERNSMHCQHDKLMSAALMSSLSNFEMPFWSCRAPTEPRWFPLAVESETEQRYMRGYASPNQQTPALQTRVSPGVENTCLF